MSSPAQSGVPVNEYGAVYAAGQFTLTNAATVVSADVWVFESTYPSSQLSYVTAKLFTDSANSVGSQITSSTGPTGIMPFGTHDDTFTFSSQSLSPGKYWLELTAVNDAILGWYDTASLINTGTDGTVNRLSDDTNTGVQIDGLMFSINGSINESSNTPEPGPLALLAGMSLSGIVALRRLRRRRTPAHAL